MYIFTREDLQQNQPRKRRKTGTIGRSFKPGKKAVVIVGLLLTLLVAGIWWQQTSLAYAIFIDGNQAAVMESRPEAEQAVKNFLETKSQELGCSVITDDKIEVKEVKLKEKDLIFGRDVQKILAARLNLLTPGAAVIIDGAEKVVVSDKKTAEALVEKIKNSYIPEGKDGTAVKTIKVELKEKVQVAEKTVPVNNIVDEAKAYQLLTVGTEKLVTHIVQSGESLWSIAKDNNLALSDLQEANAQINPDKIQIGDEIKLVKAEPMLHVTTVAEYSEVKTVPFQVEVISDQNMMRGKETVKQAGQEGSKEFTYRVVQVNGQETDKQFLEGKVLAKPVNKVVVRGTKLILASRSGGGSGQLGWPLRGSITSPFGYRHGEFHTGVDIDASVGDPVRAAEDGTVLEVGWAGNYGQLIKVDHGDGIQTWYAHLSKYEVKTGEKVERGEVIGRVGTTGRSYGSHLHFEVRIRGNPVNPLKYL